MSRSEAQSTPSYRGLLALVIILGVLIILGVIGLIVAAVLRAGQPAVATASAPFMASIPAPGAHIASTELDGNRILLRLAGPDGEELVILDAGSGRVLGRIAIDEKP